MKWCATSRFLYVTQRLMTVVLLFVFFFSDVGTMLPLQTFSNLFSTPEARAYTGDVSVYRETNGGTSIGTTTADVSWDTTVAQSSNIALQGNDSDVLLSDGGKYLVLYNTWADTGSSTSLNRRSFETYMTLDGSPLQYGRAAGLIRDAGGEDTVAYMSGGAIIDASAGQDLKINISRDDLNTSAPVQISSGTNGISIVKLSDTYDYLRLYQSSNSSDVSGNIGFTNIAMNTADEVDTGSFGYTPTSTAGNITLKGTAGTKFLIMTNVRLQWTGSNAKRQNYETRLTLDGTEIPGTRTTGYIRASQGTNYATIGYTGLVKKTSSADQTLNLQLRRESDTRDTTVIVGNKTSLSAVAMPDNAHYVMLTSQGSTQSVATSTTPLNWNKQLESPDSTYSHSTTTNSSRVTINTAGNYLFFSTAYSMQGNTGDRVVPRIQYRTNGSSLVAYGGHGSYNRGSGAYSSGSSGGLILDGVSAGDYLEVVQSDATNGYPSTIYPVGKIALQGVDLASLSQADTVVSELGTQVSTLRPSSTNQYLGDTYVIKENTAARNLTSVTLSESGSINAQNDLQNVKLFYDLDTTAPYDCASESYSGSESQFGNTDTDGFSSSNGTVSFSDSVAISPTRTFCGYAVTDVDSGASNGQTLNVNINSPTDDVLVTNSGTVGPSSAVGEGSASTITDPEITQVHYQWRNDDGSETAASSATNGNEDTPALNFASSTSQRLRVGVYGAGTGSSTMQFRLEYAQKAGTCSGTTGWTDVGDVGGAWNMYDSSYLTNGDNTTNIGQGIGGLSDPAGTFLTPNGGVLDTTSESNALTITDSNFTELEYAITPTSGVTEGVGYCFRLTDAGTPLRDYAIYPEATISGDVTVSAIGTQTGTITSPSTNNYVGGTFVIKNNNSSSRTINSVTLNETGSINAQNDLQNVKLFYDLDTTAPYDCASESYSGSESQFGSTDADGFSSSNGTSTYTDAVNITNTSTLCLYPVTDVTASSSNGKTIDIGINDPSTDVVASAGSVGPGSTVALSGSSVVAAPVSVLTGYHWRLNDDNEVNASQAVDENTAMTSVQQGSIRRLRFAVENTGPATSTAQQYTLQYGTKVTSCSAVGVWNTVGGSNAFVMASTSLLVDGDNTTNIATSSGGITDPNTQFVTANRGQIENSAQSSVVTLGPNDFTELEYAVQVTNRIAYDTSYCFRLARSGAAFDTYLQYGQLTTQQEQDFLVQRGTETITGTSTTLTAGVDYVAPKASTSAFIRITNTAFTGAGDNANGAPANADDVTAYIADPQNITDSVTIARPSTASGNTRVSWEMVEYVGIAGADNEMIVRDVGSLTYSGSSLYATGTAVSSVSNDNNVAVFITGQSNPDTGLDNYNDGLSVSSWNRATKQPVFQRGDSDGVAAGVSYAVVEFTGVNWNVQRVSHTYTAAGVIETEPITAVNALSHTFIQAQKMSGDELHNLKDFGHEVWLSSIGAISFELETVANTPSEQTSVAWVIENTQTNTGAMHVYRSGGYIAAGVAQPETFTFSIGGTVNMDNASLFVANRSSGNDNSYPRAILGARIISDTQYELWKSDEGGDQTFRAAIVNWPVSELSYRQDYYRLYVDNDARTPTDPWPIGASDLGENTAMTDLDEPLGEGEKTRIRMSLYVNNASMVANSQSFKLQYGRRVSSCSAISTWNDLGDSGSGNIWRGYDATPVDGSAIATSSLLLSVSDVGGTYEEQNDTALNPASAQPGEDVEYDWLVQNNGALQKTSYCFRMVKSDGTVLNRYNQYPTLRTSGYTPVSSNWRWYSDIDHETPINALGAEDETPVDVANGDTLKLRVAVSEIEGATGSNIKFNIQYSEYSDFRDGGTTLTATTSCTGGTLWCYADGVDVDNTFISTSTLSGVDSCVNGSGDGCGVHNEASGLSSPFDHSAFSTAEQEFTIKDDGARANAVYYFRLVDATNGNDVLTNDSYPSVVTEGAQLVFEVTGLPAGTTTEGVVTDATSSASSISFGEVPFATKYEVAHRLHVITNATQGYKILVQADQSLQNDYGAKILPINGTNASPSSWLSGCGSSPVSCFGYHVGDDLLESGSARFAPNDSFAALSTSSQEVMYSSIPADDTHDIVYRIQVGNAQPSGNYATSLTYIAVPVF